MTALLSDLLGPVYWFAILGGVLWWAWIMRRSRRPHARTQREAAELAWLRTAIDRDRHQAVGRRVD